MKRTNLVGSIVNQSWCRIFTFIGSKKLPNEKKGCARDDEKIAKVRAARSVILWNLFALVETSVGIATSQPRTDLKPAELKCFSSNLYE